MSYCRVNCSKRWINPFLQLNLLDSNAKLYVYQQIDRKLKLVDFEDNRNIFKMLLLFLVFFVLNFQYNSSFHVFPSICRNRFSLFELRDEHSRTSLVKLENVYENLQSGIAYFYLQKVVKVDESALMLLVLKYSWILYLRVETNLKPVSKTLCFISNIINNKFPMNFTELSDDRSSEIIWIYG